MAKKLSRSRLAWSMQHDREFNRAGEGENTTPNDRQEIRSAGDNDHSKDSAVGNFDRASREGKETEIEIVHQSRAHP
jgi:hypothetical protein